MKDNFSENPANYARFRPGYPDELFTYLFSLVNKKQTAWDCATGNGQIAKDLARSFDQVYATDISSAQLDEAFQADNIFYKQERAETTAFPDKIFDLITVGQAIHWFDFEAFYREVERTLKTDGILAVMGYGLICANEASNKIIHKLYREITGPYWDAERRYIDESYQTIPFPFVEIKTPEFKSVLKWTFDQFTGYLNTWSAVKHYIKSNHQNPVDIIYDDLRTAWSENTENTVSFPILLRVGSLTDSFSGVNKFI